MTVESAMNGMTSIGIGVARMKGDPCCPCIMSDKSLRISRRTSSQHVIGDAVRIGAT